MSAPSRAASATACCWRACSPSPANLLVLDEPTNDLDLETLELLEDLLLDFEGTLLLVSHDRELLNNVVDGTLALEGGGRVGEYVGGYDDWVRQRPTARFEAQPAGQAVSGPCAARRERRAAAGQADLQGTPGTRRAAGPHRGAGSGAGRTLRGDGRSPSTYQAGGEEVTRRTARLAEVEQLLAGFYARWEELEGEGGR